MSTDSDIELVQNISINARDSDIVTLYERHKKLMYSTLQKTFKIGSQEFTDIESSFLSIIFDAAKTFNFEKGSKFSTWLSNQVRYACLNLKTYKAKKEISTSEDVFNFLKNTSTVERAELKREELLQTLASLVERVQDKRIKEVILNRYFSKDKVCSYNEIGKKMKITAQTALNWHNKFILFAKKNIDKEYNH